MEACVFSVGAVGFWHAVLPCPAWIVGLAWSAVCILGCVVLSRTLCALVCAGGGGFPAFSETFGSYWFDMRQALAAENRCWFVAF